MNICTHSDDVQALACFQSITTLAPWPYCLPRARATCLAPGTLFPRVRSAYFRFVTIISGIVRAGVVDPAGEELADCLRGVWS